MSRKRPDLWQRLSKLVTDHQGVALLFLLAVSLPAAFGLSRFTLDTSFERLMAGDSPARQVQLQAAREFGSDSRTYVYLHDEHLWSVKKLQALEQLHRELQQLPFVDRVDDLFTSPVVRRVEGQLGAQPLLAVVPQDEEGVERVRAAAVADPVALRNLVSADGNSLAIGISIREADQNVRLEGIHASIEHVLSGARSQFATLVQVGRPRVEAELRQGVWRDLIMLGPASALALAIVVFGLCRSALATAMAVAVGSVSLLWTLGFMGLLGIPASLLFALLPPLTLALGAAEVVRLHSSLQLEPIAEAARRTGASAVPMDQGKLELPPATADAHLVGPAAMTILTVVLGFAGYAFSEIAALRDFALAAAFAVLANGLVTLLLLPLFYRALSLQRAPRRSAVLGALSGLATRGVVLARNRFAPAGLIAITLACVAVMWQAPSLRAGNDPLTLLRSDSEAAIAADRLHQEIAGAKVFYVTLDANAEGAFRDPANLRRLADIQAFIAKQRVFDGSRSLADVVSQANRETGGGRPAAYEVPATRQLVGQLLLPHRPSDLDPYVSHDFRRANIVVRHDVRDPSDLKRYAQELLLAAAHYAGPTMTTEIVGEGLVIDAATERLITEQGAGIVVLLVFVLIVTSLMFTSPKGGVIALVPSVIPILAILAAMRLLMIPLGVGMAVLAVVLIGIATYGVSSVFFRYRDLCRNASAYDAAVDEAVKKEMAPIMAAGVAMAAGFSVLLLSDIAPIRQFGALASAALLLTIMTNLLVVPLALPRIRLVGLYEILTMSMPHDALARCQLFQGLNNYQIRKTILISELLEFRDGQCLIEQGTTGRSMYLVVSGQLDVVRQDGNERQLLAALGPGDVFGEIGFVHETYRTASVYAQGAVAVLRFDHERLKKDLALFPRIMATLNFNISGILGKRLAELVEAHRSPSKS